MQVIDRERETYRGMTFGEIAAAEAKKQKSQAVVIISEKDNVSAHSPLPQTEEQPISQPQPQQNSNNSSWRSKVRNFFLILWNGLLSVFLRAFFVWPSFAREAQSARVEPEVAPVQPQVSTPVPAPVVENPKPEEKNQLITSLETNLAKLKELDQKNNALKLDIADSPIVQPVPAVNSPTNAQQNIGNSRIKKREILVGKRYYSAGQSSLPVDDSFSNLDLYKPTEPGLTGSKLSESMTNLYSSDVGDGQLRQPEQKKQPESSERENSFSSENEANPFDSSVHDLQKQQAEAKMAQEAEEKRQKSRTSTSLLQEIESLKKEGGNLHEIADDEKRKAAVMKYLEKRDAQIGSFLVSYGSMRATVRQWRGAGQEAPDAETVNDIGNALNHLQTETADIFESMRMALLLKEAKKAKFPPVDMENTIQSASERLIKRIECQKPLDALLEALLKQLENLQDKSLFRDQVEQFRKNLAASQRELREDYLLCIGERGLLAKFVSKDKNKLNPDPENVLFKHKDRIIKVYKAYEYLKITEPKESKNLEKIETAWSKLCNKADNQISVKREGGDLTLILCNKEVSGYSPAFHSSRRSSEASVADVSQPGPSITPAAQAS